MIAVDDGEKETKKKKKKADVHTTRAFPDAALRLPTRNAVTNSCNSLPSFWLLCTPTLSAHDSFIWSV